MVYVDKEPIGKSPISTSFVYYGTREIEVVHDGYRTEKIRRKISPPWYQIPPLDFVSETLWPGEIRDERVIDVTLVPKQVPSREELLARADQLRIQSSQGIAVPLGTPAQVSVPEAVPVDPNQMGQPIGGGVPALDGPDFQPGRGLGELILPGGQLPQRIPETGGSYRPPVDPPAGY